MVVCVSLNCENAGLWSDGMYEYGRGEEVLCEVSVKGVYVCIRSAYVYFI